MRPSHQRSLLKSNWIGYRKMSHGDDVETGLGRIQVLYRRGKDVSELI